MQHRIELPCRDDELELIIDGQSDTIIVFVHGLVGHPNEHIFYNAARFFPSHGYATCRFSLYTEKHPLTSMSLQDHCSRLEAVLEYCSGHYHNIVLVGHSLGGPTILSADHAVAKALVLWDPTLSGHERVDDEFVKLDEQYYLTNREVNSLVSPTLYNDVLHYDPSILATVQTPTKVICADKTTLKNDRSKHLGEIPAEHDMSVISGSDHNFNHPGNEETLFEDTLEWIKKYI